MPLGTALPPASRPGRLTLSCADVTTGGDGTRGPGISLHYFHNFLCIYSSLKLKKTQFEKEPADANSS